MYVSPQLLDKIDTPFEDKDYITELKMDGIRLLLSKMDNRIRLYTRHRNEVTSKFAELIDANIDNGTVLDGELVVSDDKGRPDFEAVMERFQSTKSEHRIQYLVFDILYYKGEKVTHLPLLERKKLLEQAIPKHPHIFITQWVEGNAVAYYRLIEQQGLEGIVMKKKDAPYQIDKRSKSWLKCINYQFLSNVVITGYRKEKFGLLLAIEEDGNLKNVGVMEFMPVNERKVFYDKAKSLATKETKDFIFIKPDIKCNIKFRNWTKANKLRIPSFISFTSQG